MNSKKTTITPHNPVHLRGDIIDLLEARARFVDAINDIQKTGRDDINKYESEGVRNATYALAWATGLMLFDIVREGLSSYFKAADMQFKLQDKSIEKANEFLKALSMPTIATREDVLRSVDPNLQDIVVFLKDLETARDTLKEFGVKAPKEADILLNLGVRMTEDTIIMLQSGQTKQAAQAHANSARAHSKKFTIHLLKCLREIDAELIKLKEKLEINPNIYKEVEKKGRTA